MTKTRSRSSSASASSSEWGRKRTSAPSRLGRTLYSGILMYMAIDGFQNNDKRVAVAEEKGVPMADVLVPFVTGMLFVANLGVLCWKFPRASAGALIVFFLGTTPGIHDFWTMEGESDRPTRSTSVRTSRCSAAHSSSSRRTATSRLDLRGDVTDRPRDPVRTRTVAGDSRFRAQPSDWRRFVVCTSGCRA